MATTASPRGAGARQRAVVSTHGVAQATCDAGIAIGLDGLMWAGGAV